MDSVFINGILAFAIAMAVFVGSVWLLLSMILGSRLGYFVMAASFFGIMTLMSLIWVGISLIPLPQLGLGTALGPKGEETGWHAIAAGPDVSSVEHEYGTFNVSDYPGGDWEAPGDEELVDGAGTTERETENALPVLEGFINDATSPIPGKRDDVAEFVQGEIDLVPGEFQVIDIRMKRETVAEKESLIAVGRAVPSGSLTAVLPDGIEEAKITEFLIEPGDAITPGQPLMEAATPDGRTVQISADQTGELIRFGLRIDDVVKPGIPFATIDLTGQPDAPAPAEVVAVRKIGTLRVPSYFYLAGSTVLFALHLFGLSRIERPKMVPQPA